MPPTTRLLALYALLFAIGIPPSVGQEEEFRSVELRAQVDEVQPMTGLVLWSDNDAIDQAPVQLEFAYFNYAQIVTARGTYDWTPLDELLEQVGSRGHQLVLRWYDTYVGRPTGIPTYVTELPGYRPTHGESEGQPTEFPDWSHPEARRFLFDFFREFATRYDRDPRIAFLQVGFGLWSEYHIYDGPLELGRTFPTLEMQSDFTRHLESILPETRWMVSVDAANDWAPFAESAELLELSFGLFDDSFNHAKHSEENEPNWNRFGRERWQRAPMGGEFSFFETADQRRALAPDGPHGTAFETQAARFHVSFIVGDDQPRFHPFDRLRNAGLACGYRFRVTRFEASEDASRIEIENCGIAPIYYDAFPAIDGVRATRSLLGLLPGQRALFEVPAGGQAPKLSIECDRLVAGQRIGFEANLKTDRQP